LTTIREAAAAVSEYAPRAVALSQCTPSPRSLKKSFIPGWDENGQYLMRRLEDEFGLPAELIIDTTEGVRRQRALLQQLVQDGKPTQQAEAALKNMLMTLGAVREQRAYLASGGRLN
jgi:hypothetical protein